MIITIPDDDSELDGSTTIVSKAETPASVFLDSSICQSNGNETKKNGLNPDPAAANAARGHSTCRRMKSVDGVSSDHATLSSELRSRSEAYHAASLRKSNSAHPDGMSFQSNLVTEQVLMVDRKVWSWSFNTIPYIQCLGTVMALQLSLSHTWGLRQWEQMI